MRRLFMLILGSLLLSLAFSGTASAITAYPQSPAGSTFTTGADGWTDTEHSCSIILPNLLCTTANTYAGTIGNPPGSIQSSYTSAVGLLGINTGTAKFQSPSFTLTGPGPIGPGPIGAIFHVDRRAEIQALIDVGGSATSTIVLVDEGGPDTTLVSGSLGANTSFFPTNVNVPSANLTLGHTYHIEITTTFTTALLQVALGTYSVQYDNVALLVADGTGLSTPSATTLPATDITGTSATLNSVINPNGVDTEYGYQWGPTNALGNTAPAVGVNIGDGTGPVQPNATPISGLAICSDYFFRIVATNANGSTAGNILQFKTDCPPTATTLPSGPSSATTATLNGSITPNGAANTTYAFEYGTTLPYSSVTPVRNAFPPTGFSDTPVSGEPIGGLLPETTYHYRLVATNAQGVGHGADMTFTTPSVNGPTGATGPTGGTGPTGAPGTNGTNGTNGVNGTNGAQGAPGVNGVNGAPGTPGATGKTGATGATGKTGLSGSDLVVQNGKGLLKIKSKTVKIGLTGRRAGQIRLPIFCTKKTGRSCAGTLKVRTINKINPSTSGGKFAKRRVTFFTGDYQLKLGAVGVVIGELQPEKLDLARKVRSIAVLISITVTDSIGNRQTILQNGRLIASAKV